MKLLKHIVARTYKPLLAKYLSKTRTYSYGHIRLEIPPQVFHPGFFFSTGLLLRYISALTLPGQRFLELGAGSGLISIYAAKKGALITASDINPVAVSYLQKNATNNQVQLNIIYSDLFDQIPPAKFDYILINPPYYKRKPVSHAEYAWYCGEQGEYFQNLFKGLAVYMNTSSEVLMILCDGCDIDMVEQFSDQYNFRMQCVYTKSSLIEKNYVFKIIPLK